MGRPVREILRLRLRMTAGGGGSARLRLFTFYKGRPPLSPPGRTLDGQMTVCRNRYKITKSSRDFY